MNALAALSMAHYSTPEAARLIGVSRITLRRWRQNGRLKPAYRAIDGWVYTDEDIRRAQSFPRTLRQLQNGNQVRQKRRAKRNG